MAMRFDHCSIYQGYYSRQYKVTLVSIKIKGENLVEEYLWHLESTKGLDN